MPYKTRRDYQNYLQRCRERYARDSAYRERIKAYRKAKYDPEINRNRHLRVTYGITLADYARMLDEQNHVCKICRKPPKPVAHFTRLQVDHCHKTGQVRGLLCYLCNKNLAWLEVERNQIEAYLTCGMESSAPADVTLSTT